MNLEVDEDALDRLDEEARKTEQRRKLLSDIRHEMRHTGDYYSKVRRAAYTVALTPAEAAILDLSEPEGEVVLDTLGANPHTGVLDSITVKYRVVPAADPAAN